MPPGVPAVNAGNEGAPRSEATRALNNSAVQRSPFRDTDTRPRVLPGLVTSIHHRNQMLRTVQALPVTLTGCWGELIWFFPCDTSFER
jgi:hypothetical protein